MAQYRAIFKNANIAMFAAMAAAALAAGQAQAAAGTWADIQKGSGDTISSDTEFTGTNAKEENTHGFTLNITGGTVKFIGGANAASSFEMNGVEGHIVQAGGKLVVGTDAHGASVKVNSFKATAGDITIGGHASEASSLEAATINLQGATTESPAAEATFPVSVTLAKSGALGGANSAVTVGTGAKIVMGADTTGASIAGKSLTLNGGVLTVDAAKNFKISSETVDVKAGSDFSIGTGTVTFDKATAISFAAETLTNGGNIALGELSGTRNVSLSVDGKTFNEQLFKDARKVTVSGGGAAGTLTIEATGDEVVNLVESGLFVEGGTIDTTDGLASGGTATNINVTVKGKDGTLAATTLANSSIGKVNLEFDTLTIGKGADFELKNENNTVTVKKGLTVSGSKALTLENSGSLILAGTGGKVDAASLTVGKTNKGTFNVNAGEWTVPSLVVTSGTATIGTGATLVIAESGNFTTTDNDNSITIKGTLDASQAGTVTMGTSGTKLVGGKAIFDMADVLTVNGDKVTLVTTVSGDSVSGDAASVLQLQNAGELSTTQIAAIKKALENSSFGFLEFGGESTIASASGEKTWNDIKDTANIAGANKDVTLKADEVSGAAAVGNIKLDAATELKLNKNTLILGNASANNVPGKFIVNKSDETAGVQLSGAGSQLILADAGEIGSITVEAGTAKSGAFVVGHVSGKGDVTVKGTVGTAAAVLGNVSVLEGSKLSIKGDQATDGVFAKALKLELGSALDATGKTVQLGEGNKSLASSINGNLNAKELKVLGNGGSLDIAGNAVVDVETLTGAKGITFNVGKDGVANGSATLIVDTMTLGSGSLFIDPDWDQTKASAVAMNLSGTTTDKSAGELDGKVAVGKNAAFGVGFSSLAEMNDAIAPFLPEGKFSADGVTNALVLNKQITIKDGAGGIMVGTGASVSGTTADQVDLEAGSALVITDNVFNVADDGTKTGTAITFGKGTAATANVTGAQMFLVGEFTAKDNALNIFEAGTNVTGNMTVESLNGLLQGTWTGGAVDLNLTTNADKLAAAFTDASAPVRQLMLDAVKGELGNGSGLGRDFITPLATTTLSGAVVDAAAHAATYAGAQQAAVVSVTTMADAMFGRVGAVGVEAASIAATGSQANGGVWLTPMYKSMDADGFNAEGVSYGSDVDAAGVAFGADTVNGNMRFGAVFNIGSGDADGKGQGNGLKDEFDYYGFGIYSAMGFGSFALVGDASMTVISHEVEGLGLRGKADTTAVTMGLTGQYTVATPAVDVTPHLGARFIRLNTDSYDLIGADGAIATTDFDVQNVFSVPLGVTLSKAFVTGGWSLAPSADLTVAFNTGDTEAKSTTTFTGIGHGINLNTEVLDEVQYGLTLGLGAQNGAFGTSLNVNYTGSSNTDSFGVNAQCRYMF